MIFPRPFARGVTCDKDSLGLAHHQTLQLSTAIPGAYLWYRGISPGE